MEFDGRAGRQHRLADDIGRQPCPSAAPGARACARPAPRRSRAVRRRRGSGASAPAIDRARRPAGPPKECHVALGQPCRRAPARPAGVPGCSRAAIAASRMSPRLWRSKAPKRTGFGLQFERRQAVAAPGIVAGLVALADGRQRRELAAGARAKLVDGAGHRIRPISPRRAMQRGGWRAGAAHAGHHRVITSRSVPAGTQPPGVSSSSPRWKVTR